MLLTTVVNCPGLAPLTCVGNETTMVPTNLTEMRGDLWKVGPRISNKALTRSCARYGPWWASWRSRFSFIVGELRDQRLVKVSLVSRRRSGVVVRQWTIHQRCLRVSLGIRLSYTWCDCIESNSGKSVFEWWWCCTWFNCLPSSYIYTSWQLPTRRSNLIMQATLDLSFISHDYRPSPS